MVGWVTLYCHARDANESRRQGTETHSSGPRGKAHPGGGRRGEELPQLPGRARQGRKLHAPTWLSETASQRWPATRPGNDQPTRRDSPSRAPPVGSARGPRAAAASGLERGPGPPPDHSGGAGRATHMCGFLRKALVMSFTTLCTSTATSSLVSAMLAAAAIRRASGRTQPPAGVPRGRARAGSGALSPRPTSTSGSWEDASLLGWARSASS